MCIEGWQNGSAMCACGKRGVRRAVVTGCEGGRSIGSRTWGRENRQNGRLGESLPEGHRTIGFHEETAEADHIRGRNDRKAGSGGMALRGGHFSTMPVLKGWRNGRNAGGQTGKPTDARGECCRSAASSTLMARRGWALVSPATVPVLATSSMVRGRGLAAGVNSLGRR